MSKTMKISLSILIVVSVFIYITETIRTANEEPESKSNIGFADGSTAGYGMARLGAIQPDKAKLDAMARQDAHQKSVPDGERAIYIHNWKTGFDMGWRNGD